MELLTAKQVEILSTLEKVFQGCGGSFISFETELIKQNLAKNKEETTWITETFKTHRQSLLNVLH